MEKYNNPAAYGIDEVIHFNENFRSDRKIIDYCNRVFGGVMSREFGGIEYGRNGSWFMPKTAAKGKRRCAFECQ